MAVRDLKAYKRDWARAKRGWVAPVERACVICEVRFVPDTWHPRTEVCSPKCSKLKDYRNNRARCYARSNAWRKANPIKFRQYQCTTHNRNREKYRAMWRIRQQRRNARIKESGGDGLTATQWQGIQDRQGGRCWWCGNAAKLQIDHVVPVSKKGRHEAANIVGACASCNPKKGNRDWPLSRGVLWQEVNAA